MSNIEVEHGSFIHGGKQRPSMTITFKCEVCGEEDISCNWGLFGSDPIKICPSCETHYQLTRKGEVKKIRGALKTS